MLTCEDYIIYPCYQKKFMLACFLMSLLVNHGFSYFGAKTSFLIPLNFGCCKLKPMEKILDIYKLMTGENLLVPYLRAFAIKKSS